MKEENQVWAPASLISSLFPFSFFIPSPLSCGPNYCPPHTCAASDAGLHTLPFLQQAPDPWLCVQLIKNVKRNHHLGCLFGFQNLLVFPCPFALPHWKAHQFTVPSLCQVSAIWACKLASQAIQILPLMNIARLIQPHTPSSFVSACSFTCSSKSLPVHGSYWADRSNTPGIRRTTGLTFWLSTSKA